MVSTVAHIGILPVSGIVFVNGLAEPDAVGSMRIDKMAELVKSGLVLNVAITGGDRGEKHISIADAYVIDFWKRYPAEAKAIKIISAKATCTVRDLVALHPDLRAFVLGTLGLRLSHVRIAAVSHPTHIKLATKTMKSLGYKKGLLIHPSGEPPPYSIPKVVAVWLTLCLDARWESKWLGARLAAYADRVFQEATKEPAQA